MRTAGDTRIRGAVFAGAALMAVAAAACGSNGPNITAPTLPSTTTTAAGSSTTTEKPTTTTTERTTTTTGGGTNTTAGGGSTTTTASGPTTTVAPTTTTTTEAPTTTTTDRPTTTTTRATTTTTGKATTTTTAAGSGTTATTATIDGTDASSSGPSPWLWVGAVVLLLIAALVGVLGVLRSRKATRARWLFGARDLAARSGAVARSLDEAAALLAGPVAVNRQVWLDDVEALTGLATTAGVLGPDAPEVPGDPQGTNSMQAALAALGTDLTVLRSAATEAERIRFELLGPTTEQLDFASRSVRQAAASVIADAHAVSAAADRIAPPAPVPPTAPGAPSA